MKTSSGNSHAPGRGSWVRAQNWAARHAQRVARTPLSRRLTLGALRGRAAKLGQSFADAARELLHMRVTEHA